MKLFLTFAWSIFTVTVFLLSCNKKVFTPEKPILAVTSISPLRVEPGDTVVIQGTNFSTDSAATNVWIGNVATTVISTTPTSVSALVPLAAVSNKVSISCPNGTDTSAATLTAIGSEWIPASSQISGSPTDLFKLAWSGDNLIAVGTSGITLVMADGTTTTWNSSFNHPAQVAVAAFGWIDNRFVLLGADDSGDGIWISADGVSWQTRQRIVGNTRGMFCPMPNLADWVMYFIDGGNIGGCNLEVGGGFAPVHLLSFEVNDGIAISNAFVCVGSGYNIAKSSVTNYQQFNPVNTNPIFIAGTSLNAIDGDDELLVAVGGVPFTNPAAIALWSSDSGKTWTSAQVSLLSNKVLYDVACSGKQCIAVGANGTVLASANGQDWVVRSSGAFKSLNAIIWITSLKQFFIVGDDGTILVSK